MIKPAWPHLKRTITKKGPPAKKLVTEQFWTKVWKDLEPKIIQNWIKHIPTYIQEILKIDEGNEYQEGREKPPPKLRKRKQQQEVISGG